MSFETIALVAAWAIGLIIVLSVIAPALVPQRPMYLSMDDGDLSYEDDFYGEDGPIIDAEPA